MVLVLLYEWLDEKQRRKMQQSQPCLKCFQCRSNKIFSSLPIRYKVSLRETFFFDAELYTLEMVLFCKTIDLAFTIHKCLKAFHRRFEFIPTLCGYLVLMRLGFFYATKSTFRCFAQPSDGMLEWIKRGIFKEASLKHMIPLNGIPRCLDLRSDKRTIFYGAQLPICAAKISLNLFS